jgi:hypothetical protein
VGLAVGQRKNPDFGKQGLERAHEAIGIERRDGRVGHDQGQ